MGIQSTAGYAIGWVTGIVTTIVGGPAGPLVGLLTSHALQGIGLVTGYATGAVQHALDVKDAKRKVRRAERELTTAQEALEDCLKKHSDDDDEEEEEDKKKPNNAPVPIPIPDNPIDPIPDIPIG